MTGKDAIRVLMGRVFLLFLLVCALACVVVVLSVPVYLGWCVFENLQDDNFYPAWANVMLAIFFGVFTGAIWVGLLFIVIVFVLVLFYKPLFALAATGLLAIWLGSLALGLISSVSSLPAIPEVASPLRWILTAVFVVLGIVGVFKGAIDSFESDGWKETLERLADDEPINPPGMQQNLPHSNVKHRGEGFVILDK